MDTCAKIFRVRMAMLGTMDTCKTETIPMLILYDAVPVNTVDAMFLPSSLTILQFVPSPMNVTTFAGVVISIVAFGEYSM